ncbi:amino acid permease [Rhodanobacter glycinis]|uniref:Amino acid permease n=1 Tax=Rhodanobacter glycinis TaxID=582702 RepID=A0A502CBJ1_9GAMM|nr:amino acid permease [Rhodanobacter glycinis]TPG10112.1 amino acid permease [Rhodanobacter glycinis]TPG50976.1 amino acid permease [Rhodanobacter glycinis]
MIKGLFATHTIEAMPHVDAGEPVEGSSTGEVTLKRVLTARHLVMLGIGAVIGAGIFVLTGTAAAQFAGPALVISFLMAGFACALAGLCYAEFAAMLPVSGSAYSYSYATLGEVVAWFVGWNLVLEYLFAASTVAVGWSGYFNEMLRMLSSLTGMNFTLPAALSSAPFTFNEAGHLVTTGTLINVPAIAIVAAISWLCYRGITQSATVNAIIVAIKVVVILLFLVVMFNYINTDLWHPFVPANEGGSKFGWSGVIRGATLVFFAYIGFDAVSTAAGEAKNPQRDMPIGILGSLFVCTLLYIAMAATLTGVAPFRMLNTPEPVATALNYVLGNVAVGGTASYVLGSLKILVVFAALAGLSSVVLVMLMGQPRIFYAMSRDGLMPQALGRLHPKHRTPYVGTIIVGVIAATLAGLFPVDVLGDLVSMGTLLAFATVCIGVLVLRRTRPELPRAFRVPLPWIICPLGAAACLILFWQAFAVRWPLLISWTAIGFLIYGFYGYQHSKLRQNTP